MKNFPWISKQLPENIVEPIRDPVFSTVPTLQFAVVQHFNTAKVKPVHALIDCRGGREGGKKEGGVVGGRRGRTGA